MAKFEIESVIRGDLDTVANEVFTMNGINYELLPFIKMAAPQK